MTDTPTDTPATPPADGRSTLYLALLILYVIVLAVGTVGELFHIQWILDLPIY
ncbi:MAG: hypothetical protein HZA24_05770 [Nitrospirae bacterium]|nr:hypothetical protein [Nitrospirota bacterium]